MWILWRQRQTEPLLIGRRRRTLPETSQKQRRRRPPCGINWYGRRNNPDKMKYRSWPQRRQQCRCVCIWLVRPNNRWHPPLHGGRNGRRKWHANPPPPPPSSVLRRTRSTWVNIIAQKRLRIIRENTVRSNDMAWRGVWAGGFDRWLTVLPPSCTKPSTKGGVRGTLWCHSQYIVAEIEYYIYILLWNFRRMRGPTISLSKLTHGAGGQGVGGGGGGEWQEMHRAVVVYKTLLGTDVDRLGIVESGCIFLAGDWSKENVPAGSLSTQNSVLF